MKKALLIFLTITLLLAFQWFKTGEFMATGEEGLSLYRPLRTFQVYKSVWYETGTGYALPVVIPRLTLFGFTSLLDYLIFPSWVVQAITFWILLTVGTLGMFLLGRIFFKDYSISVLASLFYLLNLYSQSQVWGRFLTQGMFSWAYLPLFLFLFIRWLREKNIVLLLLFILSSVIFSNTFGQPASIFTLWVPAGLFVLVEVWAERKRLGRVFNLLAKSLFALSVWLVVNIWWIYPEVKLSTTAFSSISNWKTNFDSLRGVSQYFPIEQILLLRQGYLFGKDSLWFSWYNQPWVWFVSVLILVIAVAGWISGRKLPSWKWLTVMAFVGWFISKGSNPPFGYGFFSWLFSNFPFMAVLRNPYEKFGIVWLLPYSIFFALGLMKIKNKIAQIGILFLTCGVLIWPMWTGDLYKTARVKVPDYYKQANDFLNQDKSSGRILMLPIIPGDGVRYSWGYQGIEPSEFLFDKPAISKVLRTKYADDKYWQLYESFINNKDYERILNEMNVKYLILHDDLISEVSGASSSAQVRKTLEKNKNITLVNKYGQLEVYKYNGNEKGELFAVEGEKPGVISYTEANNRHYIVNIKNVKKPYSLIFKETFNDLWQARVNGEAVRDHFLVYDYANGWKMDKEGDYTIDIVFKVWPWD